MGQARRPSEEEGDDQEERDKEGRTMIYKRGTGKKKLYWMDATVNGIRYRKPLRTKDWQKAKEKERELIQQAIAGLLSTNAVQFARLGFSGAADKFVEDRKAELAESSYRKERQLFAQPKKYFGSIA